ncbi:MAG: hypothetical protein BEN19_06920 [Epulopiscium sp. Nuni2H_MBin003]|nr:MAG: hypothetical protein BEN19_06920 [Epulopiscium sp. Nuni2H_MBin003]
MYCDFDKLSLYIDDELEENDKIEIEKHLQSCNNCRDELKILNEIKQGLSKLNAEIELPDGFHTELMKKIAPPKKYKYTKYYFMAASLLAALIAIPSMYQQPTEQPDLSRARTMEMAIDLPYMFEFDASSVEVVEEIKLDIENVGVVYNDMQTQGRLYYLLEGYDNYKLIVDIFEKNNYDIAPISDFINVPEIGLFELIVNYP